MQRRPPFWQNFSFIIQKGGAGSQRFYKIFMFGQDFLTWYKMKIKDCILGGKEI
jgi:hypothetical protein